MPVKLATVPAAATPSPAPAAVDVPSSPLNDRVRAVLEQIRPAVQADGGDVELVGVDDATKTVQVRFRGSCIGCPSLPLTLHKGIERMVRQQIPEIAKVEAVA